MILYNLSICLYNVFVRNTGKDTHMAELASGFEYLEQLRKKNGKQVQNFKSLSRYLDFRAREKSIPIFGQFELTPLCNFSCRMCYVHLNAEQLKGREVLGTEAWKDLMRQAWENGMVHATLTGGECLTYPGFDELYLYLQGLGCETSVLTNGFLLDEQRIRFFQKNKPSLIQVTLYGWNDDVYERVTGQRSFGTVAGNIQKAIEAGLPVRVNVTPSTYLGEDVLETVRFGKKICSAFLVTSGLFAPRKDTGRSEQDDNPETDMYIRIYKLINELDGVESKETDRDKLPPAGGPCHECKEYGLRCGGGRSSFVMTWEGILMPCNRMDMIRADARKDGFLSAWKKVNQGANSWPQVPECNECPYNLVCERCAANQLRFAAPGKQPTELCERTKAFVQHGVRHIPDCE